MLQMDAVPHGTQPPANEPDRTSLEHQIKELQSECALLRAENTRLLGQLKHIQTIVFP